MEAFAHPLFPFIALRPGWHRVALYGAGDIGQAFAHQLRASGLELSCWVDQKWSGSALPPPFAGPEMLPHVVFDCLVIAIADPSVRAGIRRNLEQMGVPTEKILEPVSSRLAYTVCHQHDLPSAEAQNPRAYARLLAGNAGLPWSDVCDSEISDFSVAPAATPTPVNMAIVGTGMMAALMAETIRRRLENVHLYAVVSRDMERAGEFAERFGAERAYDSCEALAKDPAVQLVHIATPVFLHHRQTLLFLRHGKHVLCEKPFAVNARQAEEMIAVARQYGVMLADGLWPRYMPMAKKLAEIITSGRIGHVVCLRANLFYHGPDSRRLTRPEMCGGISLENGAYLMALASLVLGRDVQEVSATGLVLPQGVDEQVSVTLRYPGALAVFSLGLRGISDRGADIYGERGFIRVDNANEYKRVTVFDARGNLVERLEQQSGYEHEVRACIQAMHGGLLCPPEYPHEETLFNLCMLDAVRQRINVAYPEDAAIPAQSKEGHKP